GVWQPSVESAINIQGENPDHITIEDMDLGQLVQSHRRLVQQLAQVEKCFGPVLQCYYSSTMVTLCVQLYFLVYYIGSVPITNECVVILVIILLQTSIVFYKVSLAAGAVE
ncbi:unnamed protein product, partial [Meganyctiphanes norvegica]